MASTTIDWGHHGCVLRHSSWHWRGTQALKYENQRRLFPGPGVRSPACAGLAFISANLGAQEVIAWGLPERSMAFHQPLLWIGAIPADGVNRRIFHLSLFYYGSRAPSVPEYLRTAFD